MTSIEQTEKTENKNQVKIVFPLYFHLLWLGVQLDPPGFIVHENQPKRDKFV